MRRTFALALLAVPMSAGSLASCSSDSNDRSSEAPLVVYEGKEVYATDLNMLAGMSQLVIHGSITSTTEGPSAVSPPDGSHSRINRVLVDGVLLGDEKLLDTEILILDSGDIGPDGNERRLYNMRFLDQGAEAYYFLTGTDFDGGGKYTVVNSQGRIVTHDKMVPEGSIEAGNLDKSLQLATDRADLDHKLEKLVPRPNTQSDALKVSRPDIDGVSAVLATVKTAAGDVELVVASDETTLCFGVGLADVKPAECIPWISIDRMDNTFVGRYYADFGVIVGYSRGGAGSVLVPLKNGESLEVQTTAYSGHAARYFMIGVSGERVPASKTLSG